MKNFDVLFQKIKVSKNLLFLKSLYLNRSSNTYLKSTFNRDKISTFLQYKHIGFSAVFRIDGQFHILFWVASSDSNTGFGIMSQVSEEIAMSFSRHTSLRIWIMSLQDQRILMAVGEDNINFRDIISWLKPTENGTKSGGTRTKQPSTPSIDRWPEGSPPQPQP